MNTKFYKLLNDKFDNQKQFNKDIIDALKTILFDISSRQNQNNNNFSKLIEKLSKEQNELHSQIKFLETEIEILKKKVR